MRKRKNIRDLIREDEPLILPAAFDALSARLIEIAGFSAAAVSATAVAQARLALPDSEIAEFGEIQSATNDILGAVDFPVLADGDGGYGDAKAWTRLVRSYERSGAAGVMLRLASSSQREIELCVRTMVEVRENPDFLILAGARGLADVGALLALGNAALKAGADSVLVAGNWDAGELRRIGGAFEGKLVVAFVEPGTDAATIAPAELHGWGFRIIIYPQLLLFAALHSLNGTLAHLRDAAEQSAAVTPFPEMDRARAVFNTATGLNAWRDIDQRAQGN